MKKLKKTKIFIFGKKLTVPKKTEKGDPLGFSNIHSVAKQQKKRRGGPLGKKFPEKKSHSAEKNWKGGPFGLHGYGMVRGKTGKTRSKKGPFWFSSLDEIVQFGTIIFCRTFKNYFGQFVWIEKKRKATIIVAFHFMKGRLKKRF